MAKWEKNKYRVKVKKPCGGCSECVTVYPSGKKWKNRSCVNDRWLNVYPVRHLGKFVRWLDESKEWSDWVYCNVFDARMVDEPQVWSFTKQTAPSIQMRSWE